MKFQLKALVAAALVATSGLASAAIDNAVQSTTGVTSEMLFVAYDAANLITYTKDLGTAVQEFNFARRTQTALTGWGTFLATAGLNLANVRFGVIAYDNFAPTATYFTASPTLTGGGNPALSRINAVNGNMAALAGAHNFAAVGTHATAADGWGVVTTAGVGQGLNLFGATGNLGTTIVGTAALGQELGFYSFTGGTSLSSTRTRMGGLANNGKFSVDNGSLIYAPVPEPTTYALMLAGLLTLGAVARRRKSK